MTNNRRCSISVRPLQSSWQKYHDETNSCRHNCKITLSIMNLDYNQRLEIFLIHHRYRNQGLRPGLSVVWVPIIHTRSKGSWLDLTVSVLVEEEIENDSILRCGSRATYSCVTLMIFLIQSHQSRIYQGIRLLCCIPLCPYQFSFESKCW